MTVEIVAHRGASGDAPENTLAAVRAARAQGADAVEVDVQRSADGELVLVHDATLARTTDLGSDDPVGSLTYAELRRLDAGAWFAAAFAGERIPTLAELVELTDRPPGLLLELKDPHRYPGIEARVADTIAGAGRTVAVQSFDHAAMARFRALAPDATVGLLDEDRPSTSTLDAAARCAQLYTTDVAVMDAALAAAIRARGMSPGVYTVDDPDLMRRTLALGLDRIITDHPAVLRRLVTG